MLTKKKLYILYKIYILWLIAEKQSFCMTDILSLGDIGCSFWLGDCHMFFFLSTFGKSFSCLQYFVLGLAYLATDINHLSKLQWYYHVWFIPHLFMISLFTIRNKQIHLVGHTLLTGFLASFTFNTLYLPSGTWKNSHLCRKFENPGAPVLSTRNRGGCCLCLKQSRARRL